MLKDKLLTSGQVASICQVSVPTVLNWVNSNLLPSYKTAGGHNRIAPLGLLRFLSQRNMFIPPKLYEIMGSTQKEFIKNESSINPVALVADDEKFVRMLLKDLLEASGYVVVEVQDGLEACLQAGLLQPDIIILDILMPEMNGLQVVQTIHKQPKLSQTRIIVVSGALTENQEQELRTNGVEHIIKKPIPVTEFTRIIALDRINNSYKS